MRVNVKLFATLRDGRGKILMMDGQAGLSPRLILERLSIPESEIAILLVNGRDGSLDAELRDGDTLSLFPPVGGG